MSPTLTRSWRSGARAWAVAALAVALVAGGFLAAGGLSAAAPVPAATVALPTPLRFASYLDLECFKTNPYTPPATTIVTRHLNPVLANLPVEAVTLGARQQLCVPVAKNGVTPPSDVVDFVKFVDLSCYAIQGQNVNTPLNLRHLNPVLQILPPRNVTITVPQQLCVPVVKNGLFPPADILTLVSYVDLKCYVEQPQTSLGINLQLSHLNPVMSGLAPHSAAVTFNRQLCVPVQKNNQAIPVDVLPIVRWIDLEKFDIVTPALSTSFSLTISHINPLLTSLPPEQVTIVGGQQLMVPVAKNNQIPPG